MTQRGKKTDFPADLYVFPRYTIVPGHEHKAFVPYSSIFSDSPARGKGFAKAASKPARVPDDAENMEQAIIKGSEAVLTQNAKDNTKCEVLHVSDLIESRLHVNSEHSQKPTAPLDQHDSTDPNEFALGDPYAHAQPHLVVCGSVQRIRDSYVTVKQQSTANKNGDKQKHLWSLDTIDIPYTHLIYALGSHMPDPLRHESFTKTDGVEWMKHNNQRIEESQEIVIVGGGALGVEMATDIASLYNRRGKPKNITLIHSRQQLLPNFDYRIHENAYNTLKELGVNVVLGHRLATASGCPMGSNVQQVASTVDPTKVPKAKMDQIASSSRQRVRTTLGLELECDLLLMCTGQQPNSEIMAEFSPVSVSPSSRLVRVLPSLQVMRPLDADALAQPFSMVPPCIDCDCFLDKKVEGADRFFDEENGMPPHFENVYAIGDVADAFGALNAGFQAWHMADVAAENILRDILHVKSTTDPQANKLAESEPIPLQSFKPGPPLLKLTLGLDKVVMQGAPEPDKSEPGEPLRPTITVKEKEAEDMDVELTWKFMALADPSDMYA